MNRSPAALRLALTVLSIAIPATFARPQLSWSLRANAPCDGALVYDAARGCTVLFGRDFAGNDETWEWDGTVWLLRERPANTPSFGRSWFAYDSARARTVLLDDTGATWEWDGSQWFDVTPASVTPARISTALAFDSVRQRIVLFGGAGPLLLNDTWEWDGSNWIQRFPVSSPPPTLDHHLVFDSARGVTVLYGGVGPENSPRNETWEWDGTTWTNRTDVVGPTWRHYFAMTFDEARRRAIVFGGSTSDGLLADTWEYDGATWTRASPSTSAPARAFVHAFAYQANRRRALLIGGGPAGFDAWEWDGNAWSEVTSPRSLTDVDSQLVYDSWRNRTVCFVRYPHAGTWEWDGNERPSGLRVGASTLLAPARCARVSLDRSRHRCASHLCRQLRAARGRSLCVGSDPTGRTTDRDQFPNGKPPSYLDVSLTG